MEEKKLALQVNIQLDKEDTDKLALLKKKTHLKGNATILKVAFAEFYEKHFPINEK